MVRADELNIQMNDTASSRLGFAHKEWIIDIAFAQQWLIEQRGVIYPHLLPTALLPLLERGESELRMLVDVVQKILREEFASCKVEGEMIAIDRQDILLLSPLPTPVSLRDFFGFEKHVISCREKHGLTMIPEWYELPVFYFSNHRSIVGSEVKVKKPSYTSCLDFELEVACVVGKKGINIPLAQANEYIAGFMILNDWSARDIQVKEMAVGLGPSKAKDFATSLGPFFVPRFVLEDKRIGDHWDLQMIARINGKQVSEGNLKDLYWSFAQMLSHASKECELVPGEVIGSGTVGTGCLLELGPEVHPYLESGDTVELEVERLGILRNKIK